MGQGRRCLIDPEIFELCLMLKAEKGWGYPKIAEFLFHEKGVTHEDDPTKPVHRATVMRWIAKAKEETAEAEKERVDVEQMICGIAFDTIEELLFGLIEKGELDGVEDTLKFVNTWVLVRKERSKTYGLHAPKRQEITHHGDVGVKDLDPTTKKMLEDLERQVAANRAKRAGRNGQQSDWDD